MNRREKLEKSLQAHVEDRCKNCEYLNTCYSDLSASEELLSEAYEEMKPTEPELEGGGSTWWYVCGECHGAIDKGDAYCRHCGRRQRWDK